MCDASGGVALTDCDRIGVAQPRQCMGLATLLHRRRQVDEYMLRVHAQQVAAFLDHDMSLRDWTIRQDIRQSVGLVGCFRGGKLTTALGLAAAPEPARARTA